MGELASALLGAEKLQAALEAHVQRQGDALVQLADNILAGGRLPILRTVTPQVLVTIGIEDLLDPVTGPAAERLGFGATISAARARWLACDGTITKVHHGFRIERHPDGSWHTYRPDGTEILIPTPLRA